MLAATNTLSVVGGGLAVGVGVGAAVGVAVGFAVGAAVGVAVGACVGTVDWVAIGVGVGELELPENVPLYAKYPRVAATITMTTNTIAMYFLFILIVLDVTSQ